MKKVIILICLSLSLVSCLNKTTERAITDTEEVIEVPAGTKSLESVYIYSVADAEKLKNENKNLGNIKSLTISCKDEIIIDIPSLKSIDNLSISSKGKVIVKNVTTIKTLLNSYASDYGCYTNIDLPDLVNIDIINMKIDKTLDLSIPKVKKVKSFKISETSNTDIKDIKLNNIEEITGLLDIKVSNGNVYLDKLTKGNLKFSFIKSINGLENLTELNGLEIYNSGIEEIDYNSIKSINGNLKLDNNTKLKILNFGNLEKITGSLIITNNNEVINMGFGKLKTIGKDSKDKGLSFEGNIKTRFIDLSFLQNIVGSVEFISSYVLEEINLPSLLNLDSDLYIYNVSIVKKINAPLLENIGGNLILQSVDKVLEINFNSLKNITKELKATWSYSTINFDFDALETIGLGININQSKFKTINIDKLSSIKYIIINNNGNLESISFKGLTQVDEVLDVSKNGNAVKLYLNKNLNANQKIIDVPVIEN